MAKKTGTTTQAVASGITKQDAVRRALATLGKTASAKDIQKHVKETFSFDMTIDHIYNAKSNVLAKGKKKASKPKGKLPAPPEPAAGANPPAKSAPVARQPAGGISLADIEAVKDLLGRVGADNLKALADLLAR
jgi:hypothetical protein